MKNIKRKMGMSLTESLVYLMIVSLFSMLIYPAFQNSTKESRLRKTTQNLRQLFTRLRSKAIRESRYIGIKFRRDGRGYTYSVHRDGNGNGIRTSEIEEGTDEKIKGPVKMNLKEAKLGMLEGDIRDVPTSGGKIGDPGDPIKFGRGEIVSFSPIGRSSSGSVYIKIADELMSVIKIYGPSAKISSWEYNPDSESWEKDV